MKTYLECLSEAAEITGCVILSAQIKLNLDDKHLELLQKAADMYAEQSNSHKPGVVRGGVIEAQSLPLRPEDLEWVNSCVTQITPTEPLPAEGVEQSRRECNHFYRLMDCTGIMKCANCAKIK